MTRITPTFGDCRPAWGHVIGELSLGPVADVGAAAEHLVDRLLVVETLARYGWAYDERRYEVLESVFTEDAVFAGSIAGEGAFRHEGRKTVVDWLAGIWPQQLDQRRHLYTNPVIEHLTDRECTLCVSFGLFASSDTSRLVTTGWKRVQLRKQDGKWLISEIYDGLDRPF
jgi:hypothetical protein